MLDSVSSRIVASDVGTAVRSRDMMSIRQGTDRRPHGGQ